MSLERQIAKEKGEKKRAEAEARFKADAPARQKVSDILKANLDKQRAEELKKAAAVKQQQVQQALAPSQKKTPGQQLCDYAWDTNTPAWKDCMVKMQPTPISPILPSAPAPTPGQVNAQLKALAKGDAAPAPRSAPVPSPLSKQQFDYLNANAVSLQPEQRKIDALGTPVVPSGPSTLSTFLCGTPPNQFPCPTPAVRLTHPPQVVGLWSRIASAARSANAQALNDPNFQTGLRELQVVGIVAATGCGVGGAIGLGAGVPGAVAGCMGGSTISVATYGAAEFGVQVARGIEAAARSQYGSALRTTVTAVAEQIADGPSGVVPLSSLARVGGSWGTYFLYNFYNGPRN